MLSLLWYCVYMTMDTTQYSGTQRYLLLHQLDILINNSIDPELKMRGKLKTVSGSSEYINNLILC